jgi:P-type Mg2+ transporter
VVGRDALQSLLFSVALAVGLTPEFLPMITTVTLAQGAIQMARKKVIVKHLSAIQNLGSIDILCSDKTGTLTAGSLSLESSIEPLGTASDRPLLVAAVNSRLQTGVKSRSTPPFSSASAPDPTGSPRPTRSHSTSSADVYRSSPSSTAPSS